MRIDNIKVTGSITNSGSLATLSGSFSGSLAGDGSLITGVVTSSYATSASSALTADSIQFENIEELPTLLSSSQQIQDYNEFAELNADNIFTGVQTFSGSEHVFMANTIQFQPVPTASDGTGALDTFLVITGSIVATGFVGSEGSIQIGDNAPDDIGVPDTVQFNAVMDSDIIPSSSGVYSLGSGSNLWDEVHANNLIGTSSYISSSNIDGDITATSIEFTNILNKPVLYSGSAQLVDALEGQDLSLGVVSASILHEIYTTQSINQGSGSFLFGDTLDDTHTFTGSVQITGSFSINGNIDSVGRINTDDGMRSVFVGRDAGENEEPGFFYNTGVGYSALQQVTNGLRNVGIGFQASGFTTTGDDNIGIGYFAGLGATTGVQNTYIGTEAGSTFSSGGGRSENTAVGYRSQQSATTANRNTTFGALTGQSLTTGGLNTFLGWRAGLAATTGTSNIAIGANAAYQNMNGDRNIIIGFNTGVMTSGDDNTIIIGASLTGRGSNTTTIGTTATTSTKLYGSLEIDGITDVSASIASLEGFSSSLDATFATEDELNAATSSLSSSVATDITTVIANVSGAFQETSGSLASITTETSASLMLLSQSFESYSSSLNDDYVTEDELNAATASLSSSLSTTITTDRLNVSGAFQSYSESFASILDSAIIDVDALMIFSASAEESIESLNKHSSSYATTGSNTFRGNQTIFTNSDARLILNRDGLTTDAEVVFETNGTTNWAIGTGKIGNDTDFTIRQTDNHNIFRLGSTGLNLDTSLTASSITSSFVGDGSGLTNLPSSGLPGGLLSSSLQISDEISGSFTDTSASFSTSQTALSSSISTDLTTAISNVSGAFQSTSASFSTSQTALSSSISTDLTLAIANVSGAFQSTSASFSTSQTALSSSISSDVTNIIDGGLTITSASYALTASYALSSSHEIIQEISSSWAETASYALVAEVEIRKEVSSSNADTASYVHSSNIDGVVGGIDGLTSNYIPIANGDDELIDSIILQPSGIADVAFSSLPARSFDSVTLAGTTAVTGTTVNSSLHSLINSGDQIFVTTQNILGGSDLALPGGGVISPGESATLRLLSAAGSIPAGDYDGNFFDFELIDFIAGQSANGQMAWRPTNQSLDWEGNITNSIPLRFFAGGAIGTTVRITGSLEVTGDDTTVTNISASGHISASFFIGDGSQLTNIPANALPGGLLSSSLQIADEISGSFVSTSASFSTSQTALSSSVSTDLTLAIANVSGAFQSTSASFSTSQTALSSSISTDLTTAIANVSGAFTEASGGFAAMTAATSASLMLLSQSFENYSSSLDDTYVTEDELNASTASLSSSLATDISASDARLNILDGLHLVSGSDDVVQINNITASNYYTDGFYYGDGRHLTGVSASLIQNGLLFGDGLFGGTYTGVLDVTSSIDTGSSHFITPVNLATASLSSSLSTTITADRLNVSGAFQSTSASFSTSQTALSSSVSTDLTLVVANVSGAFQSTSASFSTSQTTLSSSLSTDLTAVISNVSGAFNSTSASIATDITSTIANVSGAFQATSASFSTSQTSLSSSIATRLSSQEAIITIDSSSLAATASFVTASGIYGPHGFNSVLTASYAVSSSHEIIQEITSSYAETASYALRAEVEISKEISSSIADTASYVHADNIDGDITALSASYASTASVASMVMLENVSNIDRSYTLALIDTSSMSLMSYDDFDLSFNPATGILDTTEIIVENFTISGSNVGEGTIRNSILSDTASVADNATFADSASLAQGIEVTSLPPAVTTSYLIVSNTVDGGGLIAATASISYNTTTETFSAPNFTGNFTGTVSTASYVEASTVTAVTTYRETVSGATSYTVDHNLDERYPIVQSWNTATNNMEIPATVVSNTVNQITVTFGAEFSGQIVVKK